MKGRDNFFSWRATVDSSVKVCGIIGFSYSAGKVCTVFGDVKVSVFIGYSHSAGRVVRLGVVADGVTSTK